ncbi:MAG TPA: hypothetical protein VIK56_03705, partial [Rhodoferax sp.]
VWQSALVLWRLKPLAEISWGAIPRQWGQEITWPTMIGKRQTSTLTWEAQTLVLTTPAHGMVGRMWMSVVQVTGTIDKTSNK